jgi:hypothetical protein
MIVNEKYYSEFLRYSEMAKWQQINSNLGTTPHIKTPYDDDLIKNIHLYDVVERKYAGFGQLLLDMRYNKTDHPYKNKLTPMRKNIIESFENTSWGILEWSYVFFVHRLTGSGINYAKNPSGYHNSILPKFNECQNIEEMVSIIKHHVGPMFTSSGYQIASFPKPSDNYDKGGIYFMCEILPKLVRKFVEYYTEGNHNFRNLMDWLLEYNRSHGCRAFKFAYAATLADFADFYPEYMDITSHFFYGSNAQECLSYLAETPNKVGKLQHLDNLMEKIQDDTGMIPYNAEDVACDFIRWVENYANPKADYSHLDLDNTWNSSIILNHPKGRQQAMLTLGLVKSFNGIGFPSDDKILKDNNISISEYQIMLNAEKHFELNSQIGLG